MREVTFDRGRSWQALGSYSLAVEGVHPPPVQQGRACFPQKRSPGASAGETRAKGPLPGERCRMNMVPSGGH